MSKSSKQSTRSSTSSKQSARASKYLVGILGLGEVGSALARFYRGPEWKNNLYLQDLEKGNFLSVPVATGLDILHVCIPWGPNFIVSVCDAIERVCWQGVTIIHSTVPVGTTEHIMSRTGRRHIVHSPVRGVHPNLHRGIKKFVKYIGTDSPSTAAVVAEHFADLGIKSQILRKTQASELLKLLDTTYYGLAIAYHEYANSLCEDVGVNFEMVMGHANLTYNEGYAALGKKNVIRPVLEPPLGKIGGHCVVPNAKILSEQFGTDPLLESILRHS